MTPAQLYSDNPEVNHDFARTDEAVLRGPGGGCWICAVARCAMRKKSQRLEGIWKLKSTSACTRSPVQATAPESCKAPAKEKSFSRKRKMDLRNRTTRNQAQQKPPNAPVSVRASR